MPARKLERRYRARRRNREEIVYWDPKKKRLFIPKIGVKIQEHWVKSFISPSELGTIFFDSRKKDRRKSPHDYGH